MVNIGVSWKLWYLILLLSHKLKAGLTRFHFIKAQSCSFVISYLVANPQPLGFAIGKWFTGFLTPLSLNVKLKEGI